jgi:hypothetical protein
MVNHSFLETIKSFDGEVHHLSYHQKRYEKVLASSKNVKDLASLLFAPSLGLYKCKIVYTLEGVRYYLPSLHKAKDTIFKNCIQ